ncbi:capsule biosynthesis protein [Mucilaginibacter sp. MD40]|nr:capsule biosynthesis protein [Mucilaginibacter sp. MD40]
MIFKKSLYTILVMFLVFLCMNSYGQNLQNIKVDDLNDQQVLELVKKANSLGYSDDQAAQLAASRGMPPEEIAKLRVRISNLRNKGNNNNNNQSTDTDTIPSGRKINGMAADSSSRSKQKSMADAFANLSPKIFGENLFRDGTQTFEPNLRIATPKNYVIGPDDEILLDLTGDNEASYRLKVSPEGTIRVQYAGVIAVGGLTIERAETKIKAALSKTYPALRTGRTTVNVNIGNIRSIRVTLVGEVRKPGSYTVSSLSSVFNALYLSGGPNENGSFRDIHVVRNNRVIQTVDIYDFLLKGLQNSNIRLQDQDVISVPVYKKRVEMTGDVKRPGIYEMKDGESLTDLINFSGGFSSTAYTASVKVVQNTSRERQIADIPAAEFGTYRPNNGDKFTVETILNRFANRVQIRGAVFRPGDYELSNGLTLSKLITRAGGLKEDAFTNRVYVLRLNKDNSSTVLSVDLNDVLAGRTTDPLLQREDKVSINSLLDLRDEYTFEVKGEVRLPGTYKYADNMSVETAIQMAGGLKPDAAFTRVEVSRRINNADTSGRSLRTADLFTIAVDSDLTYHGQPFILQPFDVISVRLADRNRPQLNVLIKGEVKYPGNYSLKKKNERISDVLLRAGGLTIQAFPEGASLKRPGTVLGNNPNDKNDTLSQKNERLKLLNLKRLQVQNGVTDTSKTALGNEIIRSDMVGIDLNDIMKHPGGKSDLILQDGDILNIPTELQTVKVSGEVLKPINVVYEKGMSLSEYINRAGGYASSADKRAVYVEYANGSVKGTKKFLFFRSHPSVKPGAEIFVPQHAPREKVGIQGLISIATALASLAAIVTVLLRK